MPTTESTRKRGRQGPESVGEGVRLRAAVEKKGPKCESMVLRVRKRMPIASFVTVYRALASGQMRTDQSGIGSRE